MLPHTLIRMKDYLQENPVQLSSMFSEGRLNSAVDEDLIIEHLRKGGFDESDFIVMPNRGWCDIWLVKEGVPVNIKSTLRKSADNAANFLCLDWCFTNRKIDFDTRPNARRDIKFLVESRHEQDPQRDYCFLVVSKNDPGNIIINSVRHLPKPTLNSSNMPFQINWEHNRTLVERTYEEAKKIYYEILRRGIANHPLLGLLSL